MSVWAFRAITAQLSSLPHNCYTSNQPESLTMGLSQHPLIYTCACGAGSYGIIKRTHHRSIYALKPFHSFHIAFSPSAQSNAYTPSSVPIKLKRWQISVIKQLYCNMLSWKTCLEFKNHYVARDLVSWRAVRWGFSCRDIYSPNRTITPRFTTNMRNTHIIFGGRIHCLRGKG